MSTNFRSNLASHFSDKLASVLLLTRKPTTKSPTGLFPKQPGALESLNMLGHIPVHENMLNDRIVEFNRHSLIKLEAALVNQCGGSEGLPKYVKSQKDEKLL